mmetsp:Transcript_145361/g.264150  ORF Transcript_145361/g.264150 Transcript_145361/m.264150 type:complete len:1207 (-) Transcript_145361:38-3658(-)
MSLAMRKVFFQLDYYMSSQFAGVAMGLRYGLYKRAGLKLHCLPPCFPGHEAKIVEEGFHRAGRQALWVGSMEQNTLLPAVASGCAVKAVAAMFGKSPLCLVGLPGSRLAERVRNGDRICVGAHADTVKLLQRLLPNSEVIELSREDKMSMLHRRGVDGIQAYDVMETLKIQHDLNDEVLEVLPLEGPAFPGVALGYSQVLFAPSLAIADAGHHETLQAFVQATFEGWRQAIRDPRTAAESVLELQQDGIDHWVQSLGFTERSVQLCGNYVKSTMRCGKLGVIDAERWNKAAEWFGVASQSTLNATVWGMNSRHIDGHATAHRISEKTSCLAEQSKAKHGKPPKLVIISAGTAALGRRHPHAQRRLQLFGLPKASWFSMVEMGAIHGVDVLEVDLPDQTTTEDILRELWTHSDADGVMLACPLPPSVDAKRVYAAIPASKDVDGIHFLCGASQPYGFAPATSSAVMQLLEECEVNVEGLKAVVIGSSSLVGRPLAHLLVMQGATVTILHSRSKDLEACCKEADLVVVAAGAPRLVQGTWVKSGAVLINIGTTFEGDTMTPDIAPWQDLSHAKLVVRTVGPLSAAMLLHNVAESAVTGEMRPMGATAVTPALDKLAILQRLESMSSWSFIQNAQGLQQLQSDFWIPSYKGAVKFVHAISDEADRLNHHPNIQIIHHCVDGATVSVNIFTQAIMSISEFDFELAQRISQLYMLSPQTFDHVPRVSMADFHYDLPECLIAQFPQHPRGASRLLVAVPGLENGSPNLFTRAFGDLSSLLPKDTHLVCNASQVFAARIFAKEAENEMSEPIEVMFLSPELCSKDPATALAQNFDGQLWRCMVRLVIDAPGFQLSACAYNAAGKVQLNFTVHCLHSAWIEEGEPDGVEATLRVSCSDPCMLAKAGFEQFARVPLPPYIRREAQDMDMEAYQTVFASADSVGSVAAPTAGLHFTPDLMQSLVKKGIRWSQCALHVGAGTFRPVKSKHIAEHSMHSETFTMSLQDLEDVIDSLNAGRGVVAVGTTSARVLESLYWLAVAPDRYSQCSADGFSLGQWAAYSIQQELGTNAPTAQEALQLLHSRLMKQGHSVVQASTCLCIVPGYSFKVCDALITNFHQPDSTLVLLVSAFAGRETIMAGYRHAIEKGFRFLSYGDASLLLRQPVRSNLAKAVLASVEELKSCSESAGMTSTRTQRAEDEKPGGSARIHEASLICRE